MGTPNLTVPSFVPVVGGKTYNSDNTGYNNCVAYKKPSGNGPSINVGTTLNNSIVSGPLGLCCGDYADVLNTGPALAQSGMVQGLLCGKHDQLPLIGPYASMIPDSVFNYVDKLADQYVPPNYPINVAGTIHYLPVKDMLCSGKVIPGSSPADLPTQPIDPDY